MKNTCELPCIDCVCLPVCKQRYTEAYNDGGNYVRRLVHSKVALRLKCSILNDHFEIYYGTDSITYDEGIRLLWKFFIKEIK